MIPYDNVLYQQLVPVEDAWVQYYTLGPTKNMQGQQGQLQKITARAQKQIPILDNFKCGINPQDPSKNYVYFNLYNSDILLWSFPVALSEMITNPIFQNMTIAVPWMQTLRVAFQCNSEETTVNESLMWRLRYMDVKD